MRLTVSSRLWLAWRVLRGQLVGASWESGNDTTTLEIQGIRAIRERLTR